MQLLQKILNDVRVELAEEFDRNFERKAFFGRAWQKRKMDGKGTLLVQTGKLRRSIRSRVQGSSIVFTSSEPYAAIHNDGGIITVTAKMKRYFWAKYYELGGKIKYKKSGGMSKASVRVSKEAEVYKALALMKVGSKIKIPQRQFIGDAPEVNNIVKHIVSENIENAIKTSFNNHLKP